MAYSQSKELTDTEKRLQALKIQLFGKEKHQAVSMSQENKLNIASSSGSTTTFSRQHQDLTYLKKDLLKIIVLATIALLVQLVLYIQFTYKVFRFN